MNRQFNYIASAFVIFLLIFTGWLIVEKLKPAYVTQEIIIQDNKQYVPVTLSESALKGQVMFQAKCASCHRLDKVSTGPGLLDAMSTGRWDNKNRFYEWINNPAFFMETDQYTRDLKKVYGSTMPGFPDLIPQQTDNIHAFLLESLNSRYQNITAQR